MDLLFAGLFVLFFFVILLIIFAWPRASIRKKNSNQFQLKTRAEQDVFNPVSTIYTPKLFRRKNRTPEK